MRKTLTVSAGKATALGLAYMLTLMALFGVATIGAVAQDSGTTTVANETVAVDTDTRSAYAEVSAAENENVTVNVTWYGIDSNGTETQVADRSGVLVKANTTQMYEEEVNATAYDEYRVQVIAQANETNATATVGTIQKVAGGGGGLLGDSGSIGAGGIAAVVVVLGALYLSRGD